MHPEYQRRIERSSELLARSQALMEQARAVSARASAIVATAQRAQDRQQRQERTWVEQQVVRALVERHLSEPLS